MVDWENEYYAADAPDEDERWTLTPLGLAATEMQVVSELRERYRPMMR